MANTLEDEITNNLLQIMMRLKEAPASAVILVESNPTVVDELKTIFRSKSGNH